MNAPGSGRGYIEPPPYRFPHERQLPYLVEQPAIGPEGPVVEILAPEHHDAVTERIVERGGIRAPDEIAAREQANPCSARARGRHRRWGDPAAAVPQVGSEDRQVGLRRRSISVEIGGSGPGKALRGRGDGKVHFVHLEIAVLVGGTETHRADQLPVGDHRDPRGRGSASWDAEIHDAMGVGLHADVL